MSNAPMARDEQIRFMTDAFARKTAMLEKWMADPEIGPMMTSRVERLTNDDLKAADGYLKARHA